MESDAAVSEEFPPSGLLSSVILLSSCSNLCDGPCWRGEEGYLAMKPESQAAEPRSLDEGGHTCFNWIVSLMHGKNVGEVFSLQYVCRITL